MTYEEWWKKYVENAEENAIMELQRKAERKTANTGSFAELQIPLQKREVLRLAKQYGVDMRGITVKIQRSEKLLALPAAPIIRTSGESTCSLEHSRTKSSLCGH